MGKNKVIGTVQQYLPTTIREEEVFSDNEIFVFLKQIKIFWRYTIKNHIAYYVTRFVTIHK